MVFIRVVPILLFFFVHSSIAQNYERDSLLKISIKQTDTSLVKTLNELFESYRYENPDSARLFVEQALQEAQKITWKEGEYEARYNQYFLTQDEYDFDASKRILDTLLTLSFELMDARKAGAIFNKLSLYYKSQGDLVMQLKAYNNAVNAYKIDNYQKGLAAIYHNNANLFFELGEDDEGLANLNKAYAINDSMENYLWGAYNMGSIGVYYFDKGDYDSARIFQWKAIQLAAKDGHPYVYAETYFNYGNSFKESGIFDSARYYFDQSIALIDEYNFEDLKCYVLNAYSTLEFAAGNFKKAEKIRKAALIGAIRTNEPGALYSARKGMISINKALNNYKLAYEYLDTLYKNLEEKENELSQLAENRYSQIYQEKAEKDSLELAHQIELEKAEKLTAQKDANIKSLILMGTGLMLIIVLIIGFITYNAYKQKRKLAKDLAQKSDKIEEMNLLLQSKNIEITDSIQYAKRIQKAILPSQKSVQELLPKSFIYYLPKDIVSGDFYWMEKVNNKLLFAVADCTGHGVPGAMVSVVCKNALNRAVKEFKLTEPGLILDKTREIVCEEFDKSDELVQDGMDISLCCIEHNELKFAGANNPLIVISGDGRELTEIKGDKQPVGKYIDSKPFQTTTITLNSGDQLYLFSDGFADQFGGDKGKKFKAANLKRLLFANSNLPLNDQKNELDLAFHQWKGKLEQLDDVCVMGVSV